MELARGRCDLAELRNSAARLEIISQNVEALWMVRQKKCEANSNARASRRLSAMKLQKMLGAVALALAERSTANQDRNAKLDRQIRGLAASPIQKASGPINEEK